MDKVLAEFSSFSRVIFTEVVIVEKVVPKLSREILNKIYSNRVI